MVLPAKAAPYNVYTDKYLENLILEIRCEQIGNMTLQYWLAGVGNISTVKEYPDEAYEYPHNEVTYNTSSLVFYTVSDKVASSLLVSYSIIGVYVSIVFVIGKFVRQWLFGTLLPLKIRMVI